MKVIHMISGGDVGGAKTHVLSLLSGLSRTEQVKLVCFTDGPFAEEARELGIDTQIVADGLRTALSVLQKLIREGGYEVVHCHGARANLVGSLLRRKITAPVVTTVHSDYRLDYLGRPLGRLTYGTINTVALRFLDYYIGVSDPMGDLLISRGFDPQRMYSIYNGIDFTPVTPAMTRQEYLSSVGLEDCGDQIVCGIAARLSAVKDVGTLIRAFGKAAQSCDRLRLVMAGDGEQRQELEKLAADCCPAGSYVFAGWVSDMNSFYNALDVNCLTSLSETFPYALTEGARMHCATIASRVGGVPHLIEDGVCGLLFEPKDVDTLAAHLTLLATDDDLRRTLGEALYEKASRDFSVEATVRRQKEIYASILRRQARKGRKRDGVLICGAYGRDNAGDDAILQSIVTQMRDIDPEIPLYVLTRKPLEAEQQYRIGAVYTFRYLKFCRIARHTRLYINGGGSLIQDVTSSRSLWYYLLNIAAAKRRGNRVLMYGCGIGPVSKPGNRKRAGRVIDRNADMVTLRDDLSKTELERMGVTRPPLQVTADPAILLRPAAEAAVDRYLGKFGIGPEEKLALFAIRTWPGVKEKKVTICKAAAYVREKYGLRPVFLAMEPRSDSAICRTLAEKLGGDALALDAPADSALLIGLMERAGLVTAMRLHALIFAAGIGTPLVGISYDPKVTAFLEYLGRSDCLRLDTVTAETLCADIDTALGADARSQEQAERLRRLAMENQKAAAKLLEEEA